MRFTAATWQNAEGSVSMLQEDTVQLSEIKPHLIRRTLSLEEIPNNLLLQIFHPSFGLSVVSGTCITAGCWGGLQWGYSGRGSLLRGSWTIVYCKWSELNEKIIQVLEKRGRRCNRFMALMICFALPTCPESCQTSQSMKSAREKKS